MAKIKGIVRDEAGNGLNGVTVRAHRSDTGAVLGETVSSAEESTPGVPGVTGAYEITTSYTGEAYAVGIAPAGPVRNHSIIRVVPG